MSVIIDWLARFVGGMLLTFGMMWLGLKLIELTMRQAKGYRFLCEYIWHRKEFRKWLAKQPCQEVKHEK